MASAVDTDRTDPVVQSTIDGNQLLDGEAGGRQMGKQ